MRDAANYSDERSMHELCNGKNSCRPRFPVISKVSDRRRSQATNGERVIINTVYRFFSYFSRKRFYRTNGAPEKKVNRLIVRKYSTCRITEKSRKRDFIPSLRTHVFHMKSNTVPIFCYY